MRTARTFLLLSALLATGCGPDPQPAAAPADGSSIGRDEAGNASYASEYAASGTLKLVDGHYEDSDLTTADLDPLEARGDLDGDGREDLVVLLVTGAGGSGVFRDLHLLRRHGNVLQVSPPAFLGDRVDVTALRIEHGEVVADLVVQGENDPLCCPSVPVTYRFRLAGNALTETSGQRRVFLKQ
ncbi:MAG: hypothetical protein ACOY3X_00505 [Pseudomonadota bacterium]